MHWTQLLGAATMVIVVFFFMRRFRGFSGGMKAEKIILDHFTSRLSPLQHESEKGAINLTLEQLLTDEFVAAYTNFPNFEQMHLHSPVNMRRMTGLTGDELEQLNLFTRESSRFYEWIDMLRKSLEYVGTE